MRQAHKHLAVIVMAMTPALCLALLPAGRRYLQRRVGYAAAKDYRARRKRWPAHITLSIDHGASGTAIRPPDSMAGERADHHRLCRYRRPESGRQNRAGADGWRWSVPFVRVPGARGDFGVSPGAGTSAWSWRHTGSSVKAQARSPSLTSLNSPPPIFTAIASASRRQCPGYRSPKYPVTLTRQTDRDHAISFSRIPNTHWWAKFADAPARLDQCSPASGLLPAICQRRDFTGIRSWPPHAIFHNVAHHLNSILP